MRRTLYLLRHGTTTHNLGGRICGHLDVPLSPLGIDQARAAGTLLEACSIAGAITSPLARTRETAGLALENQMVEVRVEERIDELALGDWEGRSRKDLIAEASWKEWIERPHVAATPEGERLGDVWSRASSAISDELARLEEHEEEGGLLVVSHGGVIRVLLLHLLSMPESQYHQVRIDCGSLSALIVDGPGLNLLKVLTINVTSPLMALTGQPSG